MAGLRERIELLIDVQTSKASQAVRGLKKDLGDADGAFEKTRTVAGTLWDGLKTHAVAGLTAAGAAIIGFTGKAISEFQKVALGAGKLSSALGVTAEEASRLQEVASDLGIPVSALESTIGRMNRTAANTPDVFDAIGASIVRNRDGTINVTETFLSVIQALDRIPDASRRAQAAQEIFGRSWQDISELVEMGAAGVREAMASVEDQKVMDEGNIRDARRFRDAIDELKGHLEAFTIWLGEEAVPFLLAFGKGLGFIAEGARRLGAIVNPVDDIRRAWRDMTGEIEGSVGTLNVIEGIGDAAAEAAPRVDALATAVGDIPSMEGPFANDLAGLQAMADAYLDAGIAAKILGGSLIVNGQVIASLEGPYAMTAREAAQLEEIMSGELPTAMEKVEARAKLNAAAVNLAEDAAKDAADAARDHADAMLEEADAALEVSGAFRTAAEIGMDLQEAQADVMRTAGDADATLIDLARAVQRAADKETDLAEAYAETSGQTLTHTQRLDTNNGSLLRQAAQLQGPQRRAILDYIGQINGIPPERISEIEAELNNGSVANAESILKNTSRARTSTITADANTANANALLNEAARRRTAYIDVVTRGAGATSQYRANVFGVQQARARGGPVEAGETYVVGEKRPELFVPDQDGTILPNLPGNGTSLVGASTSGASVINITVTSADPKAVIAAIRQYERNNGPGWRA